MTQSKNTKRALLTSMLSIVLCIAMLVGATFAWFTDSVTSTGNRIVAGQFKVDLVMDKAGDGTYASIADGQGDIFSEATGNGILWEPGKTEIVYLGVQNKGSLALKYNILLNVQDGGLIGSLEYAVLDGKKAADLRSVTSWTNLKEQATATGDLAAGSVTAAPNGRLDEVAKGAQEETDYFALAVHMKETAGNDYQQKDVTIDLTVVATQATAESDSFDEQYDKDAKYPAVPKQIDTVVSGETSAAQPLVLEDLAKGVKATIPATAADTKTVTLSISTEKVTADSVTYAIELKDSDSSSVTLNAPVSIELAIGKGLQEVLVTHNGKPMKYGAAEDQTYSYNAATGILTIRTSTFSPFAVSFKQDFATIIPVKTAEELRAAMAAGNGKIALADTIVISGSALTIGAGQTVEIDLGGNAIKVAEGSKENICTFINNGGQLTLKNGVIRNGDITDENYNAASPNRNAAIESYGGTLTLENCVISNSAPATGSYAVKIADLKDVGCVASFKNCDISSTRGAINVAGNAQITFHGGSLTAGYYYALFLDGNAKAKFDGTSLVKSSAGNGNYIMYTSAYSDETGEITFNHCTFESKVSGTKLLTWWNASTSKQIPMHFDNCTWNNVTDNTGTKAN